MPAPDFLDTNVLVYAYDTTDRRKQDVARALLRDALEGSGVVSMQVLAEFAATLLHKVSPPANILALEEALLALEPIRAITPDAAMVQRAVEAHARYGLHFFDGMIVAAAERAGCGRIWSEDLNPGQRYFGLVTQNPFA